MENITKEDVKKILTLIKSDGLLLSKVRILFEHIIDQDYVPPRRLKKERYSDSEGSAEEEEVYCWETDENGLLSLV